MKWNRFRLRAEWFSRATARSKYIGDLDTTQPGVKDAIEFAWLMGYNARERQERAAAAAEKRRKLLRVTQ